ncbi:MAG: (d)CMP kinase [Deltaproteobacteria bacterium]|nr:(d)CMP kinase [Deltaproteobacteria bacterium]
MNQIITVDGPAGSGKSAVSRLLAKRLDLLYLDTGAMYRAVALQAHRMGIDPDDGKALWEMCKNLDLDFVSDGDSPGIHINGEDVSLAIRRPEMDMLSSGISAVREVREAMTELQRNIGKTGGLVAEGRDMGTVVFPDADYKFFITATPEVRAERRYLERTGRGESISRDEVEIDLRKRDEQDKTRSIAPLRPAEDAVVIDTTTLGIGQVIEEILLKMGKTSIQK